MLFIIVGHALPSGGQAQPGPTATRTIITAFLGLGPHINPILLLLIKIGFHPIAKPCCPLCGAFPYRQIRRSNPTLSDRRAMCDLHRPVALHPKPFGCRQYIPAKHRTGIRRQTTQGMRHPSRNPLTGLRRGIIHQGNTRTPIVKTILRMNDEFASPYDRLSMLIRKKKMINNPIVWAFAMLFVSMRERLIQS